MKRSIILLLTSLLIAIASFSQTTYPKVLNDSLVVITSGQLKQTNLIFAEHEYLKNENSLLLKKVNLQDSLIYNYSKIDSIQKNNIMILSEEVSKATKKVDKIEKQRKFYKPAFWVSSSVAIVTLLILLLK